MEISKRLKTIGDMIAYETLADIGTDHAYIPIYACLTGKAKKAVASDIHAGPLEKAHKNLEQYKLTDTVTLRLGPGLLPVKGEAVDTIVISGMGGMMIRDILTQSSETAQHAKQLILQPQLDVDEVRRAVHRIGFKIVDEELVQEDGKFYFVINTHRGTDVLYNEREYELGKILIDRKDENLKDYLCFHLQEINKIKSLIARGSGKKEEAFRRQDELNAKEKMYREVLKCL